MACVPLRPGPLKAELYPAGLRPVGLWHIPLPLRPAVHLRGMDGGHRHGFRAGDAFPGGTGDGAFACRQ